MNTNKNTIKIVPLRVRWKFPEKGDSWYYNGPSWQMSCRFIGSERRYEVYGWRWTVGPLNVYLGSINKDYW